MIFCTNKLLDALLTVNRGARSNLWMVRRSLMSVVKTLIIRARSARQIVDLAIFSSQEALSLHSPGKSGSVAILNVSLMRAHLRMYSAGNLLQ